MLVVADAVVVSAVEIASLVPLFQLLQCYAVELLAASVAAAFDAARLLYQKLPPLGVVGF